MDAIKLTDVSFRYQMAAGQEHQVAAAPALTNINLTIKQGEWVALVGRNGSGKSTLARLINGLLELESGTIEVLGTKLQPETVWTVRKHVGMVFQNPENQFVGATVADDVAFGLENQAVPQQEMQQRVTAALAQVGMTKFADHEPNRLSGGQKQRVAIAGVLALRAPIVIFDEATSMLDPQGKQAIIKLMHQLHDQKLTVISITHDIDEASQAQRVIALNNGRIEADTTPQELFVQPEKVQQLGLALPFTEALKQQLRHNDVTPAPQLQTERELEQWLMQLK